MQVFDEPPVDEHDALARGYRSPVRRDNPPRPFDLLLRRRESGIGGGDLLGMDQRLAVEPQLAALPACGRKAFTVGEVEMHAIENRLAGGAGVRDRMLSGVSTGRRSWVWSAGRSLVKSEVPRTSAASLGPAAAI